MPLSSHHRLSGTLPYAVALTAVAGFADTHVFLFLTRVFIANMSGNLVLFGIALGEGRWTPSARFLTAIVAFVVGIGVASLVHDRRRRAGKRLRPDVLLAVEAGLLTFVFLWAYLVRGDEEGARIVVYPVLVAGAFAMGMQNASLLRVGAVAVATTYASGSVARFGSEGALALGATDATEASPHLRAVRVLGALIVAYVAGAAVAAFLGRSPGWLLVPIAALLVIAVLNHKRLERIEAARMSGEVDPDPERGWTHPASDP